MQLVRSVLFIVLMYLLMLVMGILCAPLAIWSRDGAYWSMKLYARIVLWLLRVLCGLRYEVRGTPPSGAVVVCSKHQSFLDILILARHLDRFKFIMKQELRWAPILGLYAMRIGCAPVNRGKGGGAVKQMMTTVEREQEDPGQTIIYPQGTRVAPGKYLPYKIGAGVIYDRLGQPATLVATNVGVFWGRRSLYRHRGLAVLEFLETVPAGKKPSEFIALVEDRIEAESNRLMREAGFDFDAPGSGARSE